MTSLGGLTSENLEVSQLFAVDLSELLRLNDINSAFAQLTFGHERTGLTEQPTRFALEQAGIFSGLPEPPEELLICPLVG